MLRSCNYGTELFATVKYLLYSDMKFKIDI